MTKHRHNCWEFMRCVDPSRCMICPAHEATELNGIHHGQNGGRVCWCVAGTLCPGRVKGSFAEKISTCCECDFFRKVHIEEGPHLVPAREVLRLIEQDRGEEATMGDEPDSGAGDGSPDDEGEAS